MNTKLFPGDRQPSRFGRLMKDAIDSVSSEFLVLGVSSSNDIGTHSIRKGASTFACSGCTGGPDIGSVALRCGWKLQGVLDRYIRFEAAGDQFVGRCVAGLPLDKKEFAILPPHFPDNVLLEVELAEMFPAYASDRNLYPVLRMGIASIVYHIDWIRSNYLAAHPLFHSVLFSRRGLLETLRSSIICSCSSPFIINTGIPPHIAILRDLDFIRQNLDIDNTELITEIDSLLERRAINQGNLTEQRLRVILDEVIIARNPPREPSPPRQTPHIQNIMPRHLWNGQFRTVPSGFTLPSINLSLAWNLWWNGHAELNVGPYRMIDIHDLRPACRSNYSAWKNLFKFIVTMCEQYDIFIINNGIPRVDQQSLMLDKAFSEFPRFGIDSSRVRQLTILTIAKKCKGKNPLQPLLQ
jgi:hypothetical protein